MVCLWGCFVTGILSCVGHMKKVNIWNRTHKKKSGFILTHDFGGFSCSWWGLIAGRMSHSVRVSKQRMNFVLAAFSFFPLTPSGSQDCGMVPCSFRASLPFSLVLLSNIFRHTQRVPPPFFFFARKHLLKFYRGLRHGMETIAGGRDVEMEYYWQG